jgi:NTE family protein
VVATQTRSGASIVFVQGNEGFKKPSDNRPRGIEYRPAAIGKLHVMASAAIPVLFPSVHVDGEWFMDGGVRLNTPISPAIDLLDAVASGEKNDMVVVSTDPDPDPLPNQVRAGKALRRAAPMWGSGKNEQADVIDEGATILHSIFVDRVAEDVLSLRRVNDILREAKRVRVERTASTGDAAPRKAPFQAIRNCYFGPKEHGVIAGLARKGFENLNKSIFPRSGRLAFNAFSRFLENGGASHNELLSFILFDPGYLTKLFEQGAEDANDAIKAAGDSLPWRDHHA